MWIRDIKEMTLSWLIKLIQEKEWEIQQLYSSIALLNQERDVILQKNSEIQRREQDLHNCIEKHKAQEKALVDSILSKQKELSEIESSLLWLRKENELLQNSNTFYKEELKNLEKEVQSKKENITSMENSIEEWMYSLAQIHTNSSFINSEIRELRKEKEDIEKYIKKEKEILEKEKEELRIEQGKNVNEKRRLSLLYNDMNWYCKLHNIPFYKENGKN